MNAPKNTFVQENSNDKLSIFWGVRRQCTELYNGKKIKWHALCCLIQQYILVSEVILDSSGTATMINE